MKEKKITVVWVGVLLLAALFLVLLCRDHPDRVLCSQLFCSGSCDPGYGGGRFYYFPFYPSAFTYLHASAFDLCSSDSLLLLQKSGKTEHC